ncbi:MAG: asparaginase [Planctomycetes bacterium]|nr:asparaginase [Planctomycetota bacterium]
MEAAVLPVAANPVLSVATRSGQIESWHRGTVVVCHDGERVLALGDADRPAFVRSAVKPLQALPFVERGLADRLGLPDAELAVLCASHDGAAEHVAAVRSLLARGGLDEGRLGCGPHAPFDPASRRDLLRRDEKPGKVHNNCSGKHSGFLLLARDCGDDLSRYLEPDSRAQREVQAAVAAMTGSAEPLELGLDGCGAPTFRLPLTGLARAFSRLANPAALPPVRAAACRRILAATGRAPVLLAGERRLCTALVRTWPGACLAKNGAEGVYALALAPDPRRARWPGGVGIAIKIDDGAERGYQPVVVDLLLRLGAFADGRVPPALQPFHRPPIENTQRRPVGDVHCVAPWGLP